MWPGRVPVRFEKFVDLGAEFGKRREERHRIEIALNGGAVADVHPGLVDVDAPVDAHDVAAGGVQFLEKAGGAGAEVDHRDAGGADALDQGAGVGRGEADVIVGAERAHPAIEDLDGAGAGGHLQMREGREHVDDLAHEAAPQGLVAVHEALGADEIARGAAFDHVAGHGEGRAHEADDGDLAGEGADHVLNGLAHVAEVVGVGGGERIDVVGGADGIVDDGALRRWRSASLRPMGSTGSSRSAKMMAASTSRISTGCSVTVAARSGRLQISRMPCVSRIWRYCFMYRPACRMNQTGRTSVGRRRQASRKRLVIGATRMADPSCPRKNTREIP